MINMKRIESPIGRRFMHTFDLEYFICLHNYHDGKGLFVQTDNGFKNNSMMIRPKEVVFSFSEMVER